MRTNAIGAEHVRERSERAKAPYQRAFDSCRRRVFRDGARYPPPVVSVRRRHSPARARGSRGDDVRPSDETWFRGRFVNQAQARDDARGAPRGRGASSRGGKRAVPRGRRSRRRTQIRARVRVLHRHVGGEPTGSTTRGAERRSDRRGRARVQQPCALPLLPGRVGRGGGGVHRTFRLKTRRPQGAPPPRARACRARTSRRG